MGNFERIFRVLPAEERCLLAFLAHLDDILLERDPEAAILLVANDAGRLLDGLVGFALVQPDGRLLVAPAADEHFDHRIGNLVAAQQSDMGVVLTFHLERQRVAALTLANDGPDHVFLVIVGADFCTAQTSISFAVDAAPRHVTADVARSHCKPAGGIWRAQIGRKSSLCQRINSTYHSSRIRSGLEDTRCTATVKRPFLNADKTVPLIVWPTGCKYALHQCKLRKEYSDDQAESVQSVHRSGYASRYGFRQTRVFIFHNHKAEASHDLALVNHYVHSIAL